MARKNEYIIQECWEFRAIDKIVNKKFDDQWNGGYHSSFEEGGNVG